MPLTLRSERAPWRLTAALAMALPMLLGYDLPPAQHMVSQCLAVLGWGLWLGIPVTTGAPARRWRDGLLPISLAVLVAAVATGMLAGRLAPSVGASSLALLAAAIAVTWAGRWHARSPDAWRTFDAACGALLWAARLSAGVAIVQVLWPGLPDWPWLAASLAPGRATGNLRQANHLATLLLWGLVIASHRMPLDPDRRPRASRIADACLLAIGLALSGSRIGLAGLGLVLAWAAFDRRMPGAARRLLLIAAVAFAVTAAIQLWLSAQASVTTGLAARVALDAGPDAGRNVRRWVWQAAWELALQNAWTGVGWGQFNLAWTLQPDSHRGTALFTHAHNLPLHLWAELGLPAGSIVLALVGAALFHLTRSALSSTGPAASMRRTACLMVWLVLAHSMVEYPLWIAYFLLPTAWFWAYGLALDDARPERADALPRPAPVSARLRSAVGWAMAVAGAAALSAYLDIARAPLPAAPVMRPSSSLLFAHLADFRAAHETPDPGPAVVRSGLNHLADAILLTHWAQHLQSAGRDGDAAAVARRMQEFRSRSVTAGATLDSDCPADHRPQRWLELLSPGAVANDTRPPSPSQPGDAC